MRNATKFKVETMISWTLWERAVGVYWIKWVVGWNELLKRWGNWVGNKNSRRAGWCSRTFISLSFDFWWFKTVELVSKLLFFKSKDVWEVLRKFGAKSGEAEALYRYENFKTSSDSCYSICLNFKSLKLQVHFSIHLKWLQLFSSFLKNFH
jgi:hypothetical protein